MIGTLGPRKINWRDDKGGFGVISIIIQGLPDKAVDLGEGITSFDKSAEVHVTSSWQERVMRAVGADDLQILFYLLQFTSIYLGQMCRDNGVTLVDYVVPSDVLTDFAPFRSTSLS